MHVARERSPRLDDHPGEAPIVDQHDVLRHAGRWVALGPVAAKIARELARRPGEVVPRATLERAAWGDGEVKANTIDRQIYLLRSHLRRVGLDLHTIRGHGYVLDVHADQS